jgi:hypothetical protein
MLACLAVPVAAQSASSAYAICSNQTYALCASAPAFIYQDLSYAKCIIKHGDSISAPPLSFESGGQQKNICDVNAEGVTQGYMMSTFSLPDEVRKGGTKAIYTCPGGSTGDYAQCDGGTCFKSTSGQNFPGIGQIAAGEIVCSCPEARLLGLPQGNPQRLHRPRGLASRRRPRTDRGALRPAVSH